MVVDGNELFRLFERARLHLEGREPADGHSAVQRPFHILRRHWCSVLDLRILAQLEGDGHVADVHVLGEFGLELVAVVVGRAVLAGLHLVADQAVVAVPRDLVAGDVGADAMDVEIVRTALGNDQQGLVSRLSSGGIHDGRGGNARGRKRCGGGGLTEELTPIHG